MLINYIFITLASLLLALILIRIIKNYSLRHKILMPQGVPLIGGITIASSFIVVSLLGAFLYKAITKETIGIMVSSVVMLILGLIDDCHELSVTTKFLTQILACGILILFGIRTQIVNIGIATNIIITFIWIIGITNALNLLDVLDGLTAATALIVSTAFLAISFLNSDTKTIILLLSLIGALSGFLIYNLPPAKAYLGNSGSHFLGFILAAIAIVISYAPLERKIALFSPLLILGLPIFDTLFIILIRISKKKLPFEKTNDHLPLRFLASGHSKKKALLNMLYLCLFFSVSGLLVSRSSNLIGLAIIIFVILVSLLLTNSMSKVSN